MVTQAASKAIDSPALHYLDVMGGGGFANDPELVAALVMLDAVRGTKCGVAFDEQIVSAVPAGPQDVQVDCLLTPTRWLEVLVAGA